MEKHDRTMDRKKTRLNYLKNQLKSSESSVGDWKIIKIYEARLQDIADPYDFEELVSARQAIRDEINQLQEELREEV